MGRKKIVAGNWKMNGTVSANAELLLSLKAAAQSFGEVEVVVFPPYPYLAQVQSICGDSAIGWGAQDVCQFQLGAYTGAVAAGMLQEFGCRYVLVGHSERRSLFGDVDQIVAEKFSAAVSVGLSPILCVGETLAEREAGLTEEVVGRQIRAVIDVCGAEVFLKSVIAYEPVWAIGTGKTPEAAQVQQVHAFIRSVLAALNPVAADSARILYGGSVKASNAAAFFALPDVDGGLIGGASLVASDFLPIVECAK